MNKEQLKKDHPDLYASVSAERRDEFVNEGVEKERARRSKLQSYTEADPDNIQLAQVVNDAIQLGKSFEDVDAQIHVAMRDGGKLDGENPPEVATAQDSGADLTEEDRQAAKMMGMSIEEYIKYGGNK